MRWKQWLLVSEAWKCLSLPFWSKDPRHFLKRGFFDFSQYCNHGWPLAFIWLGKDPTVGTISFPLRNPFKLRSEGWASAFGRRHGAQVRDIQDNVWKGCGGSSRREVSWCLSWSWFHSGPYLSWTAPVGRGPVLCGRSVCSHARAWALPSGRPEFWFISSWFCELQQITYPLLVPRLPYVSSKANRLVIKDDRLNININLSYLSNASTVTTKFLLRHKLIKN